MATMRGDSSARLADLDALNQGDAARIVHRILAGREEYRRDLDRRFYTNSYFLEGGFRQWCDWDGDRYKLNAKANGDRLIAANITLQIVESMVSRLTPPGNSIEADAVTTDREDIHKARLLTDLVNYYRDHIHMDVRLAHLLLTMCCSPVCWITGGWSMNRGRIVKTSFDDFLATRIQNAFPYGIDRSNDAERRQVIRKAGRDFAKLFGMRAFERKEVVQYGGELFARTVTVPEMSWYPWVLKTWDDVQFYVYTQLLPYEVIAEREGLTLDEVRRRCAGPSNRNSPRYDSRNGEFSTVGRYGLVDPSKSSSECGEYHQLIGKPCIKYPEGVESVVLGHDSEALRTQEIDNLSHTVPFFPLVQHELPNSAVGTCVVDQIRTIQIDLNRSFAASTLRRELYASPPILVEEGSVIDKTDWRMRLAPGLCRKYRGKKPELMVLPNVNAGEENAISRDISMSHEISSISSLSVGEADRSGATSGRAINALDEKTAQRLGPVQGRIVANQTDFWQFNAEELIHKPIGDQLAQIAGRDNVLETLDWTRDDIQPSTYGYPNRRVALIRITPFSSIPMNGQERRNYAISLVKSGILNPQRDPQDKERALSLLGINAENKLLDDKRVDEATARWETREWSHGLPVDVPLEDDNHEVHIQIAMKWKRSPEGRALIRDMPEMEAHIDQHIRIHRKYQTIRAVRPQFESKIASVEAWQLVQREAEIDVKTGVLDPEIYKLMPAGTQPGQPAVLLDFASIFAPQTPGAPSPTPQGGTPTPPAPQGREFVGEEEGRDVRRDLADGGVDRNQLFAQA